MSLKAFSSKHEANHPAPHRHAESPTSPATSTLNRPPYGIRAAWARLRRGRYRGLVPGLAAANGLPEAGREPSTLNHPPVQLSTLNHPPGQIPAGLTTLNRPPRHPRSALNDPPVNHLSTLKDPPTPILSLLPLPYTPRRWLIQREPSQALEAGRRGCTRWGRAKACSGRCGEAFCA